MITLWLGAGFASGEQTVKALFPALHLEGFPSFASCNVHFCRHGFLDHLACAPWILGGQKDQAQKRTELLNIGAEI